jgi:DHA2 family multidrug resistance protein
MMRNLGGAVGIAVCGAILNAQTNFHFNMIASHLTPANGPMTRLIAGAAQRYGGIPGSPEAGHLAALKTLWQLAYREAELDACARACVKLKLSKSSVTFRIACYCRSAMRLLHIVVSAR